MRAAAADLEFEEAATLRDEIRRLENQELELPTGGASFSERMRRAGAQSKSRRGKGRGRRRG